MREKNAEMGEKHRITYPILSDAGNAYAGRLSLAFAFPEELREIYVAFGISLPEHNGEDSWELPLPARIVVDAEGVIRSIDADPDYTRRPEPEATLEILRGMD